MKKLTPREKAEQEVQFIVPLGNSLSDFWLEVALDETVAGRPHVAEVIAGWYSYGRPQRKK